MLLLLACTKSAPDTATEVPLEYPLDLSITDQLDPVRMKAHVDVLADDAYGGRIPGSPGHVAARDYILGELTELGLQAAGTDGYAYAYANEPHPDRFMVDDQGQIVPQASDTGYDLVAVLPGSDPALSDEYIVLMSHYDHLGVDEAGQIFNGAYDNAASVAMTLELARVLVENDAAPGRSLLFLFTDDEESGLDGAREWISASTVPEEDIVFAVSADPLGRPIVPDYAPIILIGLERSPALKAKWQELAVYADRAVAFVNRDVIPIFASDQDTFYESEIPATWFVNLGMSYYHTVADTAETVDYRILLDDARFLAQVFTAFGADSERYDYEGPRALDGETATDALEVLRGVAASQEISIDDRNETEGYIADLEQVELDGDLSSLENPDAFFYGVVYFLGFVLGERYPGEIPPPFPE